MLKRYSLIGLWFSLFSIPAGADFLISMEGVIDCRQEALQDYRRQAKIAMSRQNYPEFGRLTARAHTCSIMGYQLGPELSR
jgi:hypothetical protein